MSKRSKKLKQAFDVQVSESRLRGLTRSARRAAIDKATRRFERGVSEETRKQVEEAEERAARILQKRQDDAEAERKRRAAAQQRRDEQAAQRSACTCRKPALDSTGKCTRCHKKPASRVRRRRR